MNTGSGRPRPCKGDHILLVDRCLAPEVAYEICKMDGLHGIPLRDHYGDITAQALEDISFLTEAGRRGWGVLTQNPRMWQVPQERACIIENHVRASRSMTPTRARPSRASSWVGTCSRSVDASGDPTPVSGDSGCREFGRTSHDRVQPSGGRHRATAPLVSRLHATVAAPRADQPRSWLQPESGPCLDGGCDLGRGASHPHAGGSSRSRLGPVLAHSAVRLRSRSEDNRPGLLLPTDRPPTEDLD